MGREGGPGAKPGLRTGEREPWRGQANPGALIGLRAGVPKTRPWLGSARLGSARLGSARLGSARLGSARLCCALLGCKCTCKSGTTTSSKQRCVVLATSCVRPPIRRTIAALPTHPPSPRPRARLHAAPNLASNGALTPPLHFLVGRRRCCCCCRPFLWRAEVLVTTGGYNRKFLELFCVFRSLGLQPAFWGHLLQRLFRRAHGLTRNQGVPFDSGGNINLSWECKLALSW